MYVCMDNYLTTSYNIDHIVFSGAATAIAISAKTYIITKCASCASLYSLQPGPLPFDCQETYVLGCRRSGVYIIDPGCRSIIT